MGSGTRNILRYAPLYYPNYKVEINNGSQFVFSITYMELAGGTTGNVTQKLEMSPKNGENVTQKSEMSPKNEEQLDATDWNLGLTDTSSTKSAKRKKRQQGIISLIKQNPQITAEEIAEQLDVHERTIRRDLEELKDLIEYVGPTKGGYWKLVKH